MTRYRGTFASFAHMSVVTAALWIASTGSASAACTTNPVTCENALPGTPVSQWSITEPGDASILGFPTDHSVNIGGTIRFKIQAAAAYHIDIYRVGWYQGNGARKVASLPTLPARTQPACLIDGSNTTGLVECGNWSEATSWAVPSTAVSGVYFARLTRNDTGGASYILFNVRDDSSHSDIVYQTFQHSGIRSLEFT